MIPPPVCVLYTQDLDLVRRVKAFLRTMAQVRHVADADRLDAVLQQTAPALLLMDLRARDSRDLIGQVQTEWPDVLITALGTSRSEPLRDAEQGGIYAAEDIELDRRRFQALAARAFDYIRIAQENRDLREQSAGLPITEPVRPAEPAPDRYTSSSLPLLRFPRVFRRFDVDAVRRTIGCAQEAGYTLFQPILVALQDVDEGTQRASGRSDRRRPS